LKAFFRETRTRYMRRNVKLDWDYKIHTSGEKVIEPVKMTAGFIQMEVDCLESDLLFETRLGI
jgi:hypothetical protein